MSKCKGCTEVARLVGVVDDLRKMMESMKRMVTGQGLVETSGETGVREATLDEAEEREKCVGEKTRDNSSTEESEVKKICSGTPIIATRSYWKNQVIPNYKKGIHLATSWNTKTLVASGRQQRTGGIPASVASDDHHGRDDSGRGM